MKQNRIRVTKGKHWDISSYLIVYPRKRVNVDPEFLSKAFSAKAATYFKIGDKVAEHKEGAHPLALFQRSAWRVQSTARTSSARDHAASILSKVRAPKGSFAKRLALQYNVEIMIRVTLKSDEWSPEFVFEPDILRGIADLGAMLVIDVI